jgi:hypothetical protein
MLTEFYLFFMLLINMRIKDWRFTANQFVLATSPLRRPVILFSNWTLSAVVLILHPVWREDGSVVYNCCWSSPAQSFSGPCLSGLMTTCYCLRFETPQPGGPGPVFTFPQNRVVRLYPQTLGSLFVGSYYSQGCGGGFRPRLHTGTGIIA